jgi:hypothetical protein
VLKTSHKKRNMVESSLQQLIYGRAVIDAVPSDSPGILAITSEIPADDAAAVYQFIALDPLPNEQAGSSQTVAMMSLDDSRKVNGTGRLVLARAHFQDAAHAVPIHQFIFLPSEALIRLGDIEPLLRLIDKPIPTYAPGNTALEPLSLPLPTTWTLDKSAMLLQSLLEKQGGDMPQLIGILGATLSQGLVISGFPLDSEARIRLVRALMLLLPAVARPQLSFSTNSDVLNGNLPRLVFSEARGAADYARIDWSDLQIRESYYAHPYAAHLRKLWRGDIVAFAEVIRSLDNFAPGLMYGKDLTGALEAVVKRHQLDLSLQAGESIAAEDIIAVLQNDNTLGEDTRLAYLQVLMQEALEKREAKIAQVLSQEIAQNPKLEAALEPFFQEALDTHPDGLYALVRALLSKSDEVPDPKWLKRLHNAASRSLEIALESGDPNTISIWLTLLSREPLRYELATILHKALLAARGIAAQSPKLAQDLLTVAVKRQPETLPNILSDEAFVAALPAEIIAAVRDFSPEAMERLAENSRELFLLAVQQSIAAEERAISPNIIRSLWHIHSQQQTNTLLPMFRPQLLILSMAEHLGCFMDNALETLLSLILSDETQDSFFYELAPLLAERKMLAGPLVGAIQQSGRDLQDIMDILNKLLHEELLKPQAAVDAFAFILSAREWDEMSLPLLEQLARVMTQHPETVAPTGVLWRMADLSGELKNEQMLKVALRRLLDEVALIATETPIIDSMLRLRKAAQWSVIGRSVLTRWWRNYAREQSTVQLQKLDKALEGKRNLEDMRSTVQTSLALRRILGNRSLEEFAEAVATSYSILQALSEGFDPDDKQVDSAAIRSELESRSDELSSDLKHILATNLKELATVITMLADSRSKPSLMKSDDTLERQLLTGDQQPQSAVDVMRWLSGYLDGMQKGEGE